MSNRTPTLQAPPRSGSIASPWMRGVRALLERSGLDARSLFAEAGLDIQSLADPEARFAVERVDHVWHLAAVRSGNPHIALSVGGVDHSASFDVLAYAMMSCRDLRESIERLIAYAAIVSDAVRLSSRAVRGGLAILVASVEAPMPGRDLRLDYTICTFLAYCSWVTGRRIVPLRVEFPYPAPPEASAHSAILGCEVEFDAGQHALVVRDDDLILPLPTANAALNRIHADLVRHRVQHLKADSIVASVSASIVKKLQTGSVTRAAVAADIGLSERTLQRRLVEQGTSFSDEVDATRRQMAETYLAQPGMPISGVAYALGFADERSFYRACERWFAMSPGRYRAQAAGVA